MKSLLKFVTIGILISGVTLFLDRYYLRRNRILKNVAIENSCYCEKVHNEYKNTLKIDKPLIDSIDNASTISISYSSTCNIHHFKIFTKSNKDNWVLYKILNSCNRSLNLKVNSTGQLTIKIEGYSKLDTLVASDTLSFHVKQRSRLDYKFREMFCQPEFGLRDGSGLLFFKEKYVLLGGWKDDSLYFRTLNDIWISNDGLDWNEQLNAPWQGRHTFGTVVYNNAIWVIAGDCNRGFCQMDVWRSKDLLTWELITSNMNLQKRSLYNVIVFNERIWIFGGEDLSEFSSQTKCSSFNDAWYSRDGKIWKLAAKHCDWNERSTYGRIVSNGKSLVLLGGFKYKNEVKSDIWTSNDGIDWKCISKLSPWESGWFSNMVYFDKNYWVIGGANSKGNMNQIWYSNNLVSWHELNVPNYNGTHAASIYADSSHILILAGNNNNKVWEIVRE